MPQVAIGLVEFAVSFVVNTVIGIVRNSPVAKPQR